MTFSHNDHYHTLLIRQVPQGCRRALDVGCGTGRFARRLADAGIQVDAVDASAEVIQAARAISERDPRPLQPSFREADIMKLALPSGQYDYISCLASIHHMQFGIISQLRDALAPRGVLVILGCYRPTTWSDHVLSAAAVPVNAVVRASLAACSRLAAPKREDGPARQVGVPTRAAQMTFSDICREARASLPGSNASRLFFWRYLLVYRASASSSP